MTSVWEARRVHNDPGGQVDVLAQQQQNELAAALIAEGTLTLSGSHAD